MSRGKEALIFVLVAVAAALLVVLVSLRLEPQAMAGAGMPDVLGNRCSNPEADRP